VIGVGNHLKLLAGSYSISNWRAAALIPSPLFSNLLDPPLVFRDVFVERFDFRQQRTQSSRNGGLSSLVISRFICSVPHLRSRAPWDFVNPRAAFNRCRLHSALGYR
jgi:hypothetical protein